MNLGFGFAFFASIAFGTGDVFGGMAARRASALHVALLSCVAAIAVLVLAMPFIHGLPSRSDLLWGAAAGVFSTLGTILIYKALGLGPMSLASPVLCILSLCVPVVVGVALGERPSAIAWTGVALSVLAIPPLSITTHHEGAHPPAHVRRTLVLSIIAGLCAGGFLTCVARIGSGAGMTPLVVSRAVAIVLTVGILVARRQPVVPPPGSRLLSTAAGATDSSANVAYWLATHTVPMALVAPLIALAPAVTVIIARVFLHERWSAWQKLGLVLALAAAVCISRG